MLQRVLHGVDRLDSRTDGISPRLRRGAVISGAVHVVIVVLLLFGLPSVRSPEEPPETAVAMVFDGTAASSIRAPAPAAAIQRFLTAVRARATFPKSRGRRRPMN